MKIWKRIGDRPKKEYETMIRIAVCDDDSVMLGRIGAAITDSFRANGQETCTESFSSGSELLCAFKKSPFDVLFLDIRMPDMSGFDVAREIRKISENVYIIFITTESALVYDSFEFQPFNFIPKSSAEETERRLENVVNALAKRFLAFKTITVKLPYFEELTFMTRDLICLKSSGNYTEYVLSGKEPVRIRKKLDEALDEIGIGTGLMLRPHKSFAVNMSYIKKISFPKLTVYLKDGTEIPVSKANKSAVEEQYGRWLRNSEGRALK